MNVKTKTVAITADLKFSVICKDAMTPAVSG